MIRIHARSTSVGAECVPIAFAADGASLFLFDHRSLDSLSIDATKRPHLLGPALALPALSPDQRRAAAVVGCGNATSLRVFDLDPSGSFVPTCTMRRTERW